ncbi:MAG TPA: cupin domain-containing protein [Phycisphaerales bacterium]|nr:cupin domain-containing protein [Phycisphaerales bacterium]
MSPDRIREAPTDRFDAPALTFDMKAQAAALRAEPTPARHGHRQKTLYKHGGRSIALFVMDPGAALAEHAAAGTVSIQAVEGELMVSVGGADQRLDPGHLLVMAPGTRHAVRAAGPSVFLLQVSLGA